MKKYTVAGKFLDEINPSVNHITNGELLEFDLSSNFGKRNNEITVFLRILYHHQLKPSEIGLDFLILAEHINVADKGISRKIGSYDNWTRDIRLIVPVSNCKLWEKSIDTLKVMLDFLTGDNWQVEFRERTYDLETLHPAFNFESKIYADRVSLFSGGLDSLIGAIDTCSNQIKQFLISHADQYVIKFAQEKCYTKIKEQYTDQILGHVPIWGFSRGKLRDDLKKENSSRARSFLFFSLAVATGTALANEEFMVNVPENGLIALNVPLDTLRLGALSTRTTHPYYIKRWNDLLEIVGINGKLDNPYWNKTKGEMVEECLNQELLYDLIANTLSCSSPTKMRWKENEWEKMRIGNCGFCVPCIIRRAALTKINDPTSYIEEDLESEILNTKLAIGQQVRSFQVAIHRLNNNENLAEVFIHKPGPLNDFPERVGTYTEVYKKGLREIDHFLKNVKTKPLKVLKKSKLKKQGENRLIF